MPAVRGVLPSASDITQNCFSGWEAQDWAEVLSCKSVARKSGARVRCSTQALVVASAGTSHKLELPAIKKIYDLDQSTKHIILNISNKGIFYNEDDFIEWRNTNFPAKKSFTFNEREKIFWQVEMLRYNKKRFALEVIVSNYEARPLKDAFAIQKPKYPIRAIVFRDIDWQELLRTFSHYSPQDFEKLVDFDEVNKTRSLIDASTKGDQQDLDQAQSRGEFSGGIFYSGSKKIDLKFKHPLMKTKFKMGCVEVKKRIKEIDDTVTIVLLNSHIIPEFDHVKPYFSKVLGKKKIEVTGYLELDENNKIKINCKSKEIDLIDEEAITSVKSLHLKKAILSPKPIVVDKSLFTPEEYFDSEQDEVLGNISDKNNNEILQAILDLGEIRNRKQLIYLSGKLQSENTRLKFTLSPKFGFLFFVEGEEMDHFLWELLDSHATYIWSISKDAMPNEMKFRRLEREINFIRENGRMRYLNSEKSSDFIFNKVNHESSKTGVVDGFPKWKMRVNEKLI